jgi:threonine 3-dehydrogenase
VNDPVVPQSALYPSFLGDSRVEFSERPVPRPGPGQLLLKVGANALCRSEMGQLRRGSTVTPGHEAAGVVALAGADTHAPVGTPGVVFLMDFCGECRSCRLGYTNQCLNKRADYGFTRDGGYGPYELVNDNVFFAIDPSISAAEATLLLDVMGTGGHALARAALVHPDIRSVLVMGAGPIGLGLLAMAKITLGRDLPVLVADFAPFRLGLAEQLGGLPIDLRASSLADGLRRHGFKEADAALDSSGKTVARRGALDALAKRGVLVCVGHGEELPLSVSPDLIATERTVLGSEYFRYQEIAANHTRLLDPVTRSYLAQIITHRFPVTEIEHAFAVFDGGETGKVVIEQ